jgi:hypothetical protein
VALIKRNGSKICELAHQRRNFDEEHAMDFFVYAFGGHIQFLTLLAISAMLAAIAISSHWSGWT